jgi:hypothetical protein
VIVRIVTPYAHADSSMPSSRRSKLPAPHVVASRQAVVRRVVTGSQLDPLCRQLLRFA